MKFFKITSVIIFFISTNLFSQEITVIELHPFSADEENNLIEENNLVEENNYVINEILYKN